MEEQQIKVTGTPRFLSVAGVRELTSLSPVRIYEFQKTGTFPKPIKLGTKRSAWIETEVVAWMNEQIAASRRAA
jgi:prophage regulatory protein